ncbi:MAG: FkbM family methyltransferase [Thermoplasmata archaeon]
MPSLFHLLRRRSPELSWKDLIAMFGPGDVAYLLGQRSATRPIVRPLAIPFGPQEKFVFLSLRSEIRLLEKRGFEVRAADGAIEVRHIPYLPIPWRLLVPPFSARELRNLFLLLRHGLTYGASVDPKEEDPRPKSIALDPVARTVTINHAVRFDLDQLDPWTLTETFFLGIHDFAPFADRIVLDVGAEFGDSSLFFALRGAHVIAVEPVTANFRALVRNLELNGDLGRRVRPVHAAIGPRGRISMNTDPTVIQGNASAFLSPEARRRRPIVEEVDSFSVADLLDHLGLPDIDVLKMDGKGCEYLLEPRDLARVRGSLAIEYGDATPERLHGLIDQVRAAGFRIVVALHNPEAGGNLAHHGTLYGQRPGRVPTAAPTGPPPIPPKGGAVRI